jgi:hypothetical protein
MFTEKKRQNNWLRDSFSLLCIIAISTISVLCQTKDISGSVPMLSELGIPHLVKFAGTIKDSQGVGLTGTLGVTFALYATQEGGAPIWLETQTVSLDQNGTYTVVLGITKSDGISKDVFVAGEARWIGVQAEGQAEQPRTLLVSVPYALKAADAETLGGKPLSAFLLADASSGSGTKSQRLADGSRAQQETTGAINNGATNGTVNFLAKFDSASTVVNSAIFENGGLVGIGIATPAATLSLGPTVGEKFDFYQSADSSIRLGIGIDQVVPGRELNLFTSSNTLSGQGRITLGYRREDTGGYVGNMTVLNSGNVGIGIATPAATLSLGPTVGEKFDFYQSADSAIRLGIGIDQVVPGRELSLFTSSNTLNGQGRITLGYRREDNGAYVGNMTVLNSGNVGVGISNPAATLSLGPTVGEKFDFYQSPDSSIRLGIGIDQVVPGRELNLFSTSNTLNGAGRITLGYRREDTGGFVGNMTLLNSGNVGIGIASPAATLSLGPTVGEKFDFYQSPDSVVRLGVGVDQVVAGRELNLFSTSNTLNGAGRITFGYRREDTGAYVGNMTILNSGNVGINNSAPASRLDVTQASAGAVSFSIGSSPPPAAIHGDATATSSFVSGVFGTTSSVDGFGILGENLASGASSGYSAGVRGITVNTTNKGTGVWGDALQISGDNVGVFGHSASTAGTGVQGLADATSGDAVGVYGVSASTGGTGVFGEVTAATAAGSTLFPAGVYGKIASNSGAAGLFDTTNASGSILIGRSGSTPVNVFRVDSTGKVFANGGTVNSGADFAESVSVQQDRSMYEPGDIMAIDPSGIRRFMKVDKPYSTLIAGIYSTKPGFLATPHAADDPRHETEEIPLAMVGIVPCKVTTENGIISTGDLLVSSSSAGYAMKGTDRSRMTGAIIGKALQPMSGATGVIQVLVSLQ